MPTLRTLGVALRSLLSPPTLGGVRIATLSLDKNLTWPQALLRLQMESGRRPVAAIHGDRFIVARQGEARFLPARGVAEEAIALAREAAGSEADEPLPWKVTVLRTVSQSGSAIGAQLDLLDDAELAKPVECAMVLNGGAVLTEYGQAIRYYPDGSSERFTRAELLAMRATHLREARGTFPGSSLSELT